MRMNSPFEMGFKIQGKNILLYQVAGMNKPGTKVLWDEVF
jgi:hypothetical protein